MDAKSELNLKNRDYLEALESYVGDAYHQDLPKTDVTTRAFLGRANQEVKAVITAKEDGILAGVQEAEWLLNELKLTMESSKKDGNKIKKGDKVMTISGKASAILAAERTLLNLLQRMSAIATKTKKMSAKLPRNIKLLATRKTLWGLLDKRAVVVGGGGTHRLSLSDAILIKENHIMLSRNFQKSLKWALKKLSKVRFVEIELESVEQVNEFLGVYYSLKKVVKDRKEVVVMLDNFTPAQIKKVIDPLKKAGVAVELSGGINERNIARYNITGVTAISSGSITMDAGYLDLSLSIKKA